MVATKPTHDLMGDEEFAKMFWFFKEATEIRERWKLEQKGGTSWAESQARLDAERLFREESA